MPKLLRLDRVEAKLIPQGIKKKLAGNGKWTMNESIYFLLKMAILRFHCYVFLLNRGMLIFHCHVSY